MKRYITKPGIRVGIVGIGGLGHMGLKFARAMGAHVTAISNSKNKENECREFGAHDFVLVNDIKNHKQSLDVILTTSFNNNVDGD